MNIYISRVQPRQVNPTNLVSPTQPRRLTKLFPPLPATTSTASGGGQSSSRLSGEHYIYSLSLSRDSDRVSDPSTNGLIL